MIFSLDVRRARKGDCLLLHFGTANEPGLMLIDGGPAGVYKPHLETRINEIRKKRSVAPNDPLPVDVLMVSHVDDDHIRGILDLTKREVEAMDAQRPRLLDVRQLWHNSFDGVIKHNTTPLADNVTAALASAGSGVPMAEDLMEKVDGLEDMTPDELAELVSSNWLVLASMAQGYRLRDDARKLGYELNPGFDDELIIAREAGERLPLDGETSMMIAGPMLPEIEALRKKHLAWLKELKEQGLSPKDALAAYIDKSVSNLSSIVALAECGEASILLTGDARGDRIIAGLELTGGLKPGKNRKVSILKVPHHGSANNLTKDFFKRITADHYVFSGNGEHGNPEREALEMLFRARGTSASFTVHLTYPVIEIDEAREHAWNEERQKEIAKGKTPRAKWSPAKHGVKEFLAQHATAKQRVRIVDEKKPHVIDLLSPLGY